MDPWSAAKKRLQDTFKPSLGTSSFGPLMGSSGKALSRFTNVALGRKIHIIRLIVPHEPAPKEEGRGSIYFFAGGQTEHAVVHLTDAVDTVYAVEIHPLTGRGKVYNHAYEPAVLLSDPEQRDVSEVDTL